MSASTLPVHTLYANGLKFAYLSMGQGPLVLCVHGFPDTAWNFAPLMQRLANAGFRAVAPFQRGYYPSEIPTRADYSIPMLGRDLLALIEHLGEAKAAIVGHDWGALAAYSAASQRPDRLTRIVAAGVPHPRVLFGRTRLEQLKASHYIFRFQAPFWAEHRLPQRDFQWLKILIQQWSPRANFADEQFAAVWEGFRIPGRLEAALGFYRALVPGFIRHPQALSLLKDPLHVPVLQVCGETDGCMRPQSYIDSHPFLPAGSHLVQMPTGHFMHVEAPDLFADRVIEFLSD